MTSCILTSSTLIFAVILIRSLLKKCLSRRVCYALWLIVAVRLLLPIPMAESSTSLMNLYPNIGSEADASNPITDNVVAGSNSIQNSIIRDPMKSVTTADNTDTIAATDTGNNPSFGISDNSDNKIQNVNSTFDINTLLKIVWIAGMIVMTLFLLVQNFMFYRYLKKNRVQITNVDCRLPVYMVGTLYTPCLYGFFHPSIYLSASSTENDTWKKYILVHEGVHYQHKDHIWALVRSLCLIIHWFNPFVWLAAILSRQDCELACDEGVIHHIGEEQRIFYGDMLLSMVSMGNGFGDILSTTTMMKSGKNSLKERISLIAHKPKRLVSIMIFVPLLMTALIVCTFTNAKEQTVSDTPQSTVTANVTPKRNTLSTESIISQEPVPGPEYLFTGGKSDKSSLVVTVGTYPEDCDYLAFEKDFDADGIMEAFILIGAKDKGGISGDLWYVNDSDEATLLMEDIYAEPEQQLFQKTMNTISYIYFLFTYTDGNTYSTDIYNIWDDTASVCFNGDRFLNTTKKVMISGGDLIFTDEEYDFNYLKKDAVFSGHTIKYYTYHFLDSASFEQYASDDKSKDEFLVCKNADTILKNLEAEYHPDDYQFINRSNGEWDINMAIDEGDNYTFYYAVYSAGEDNSLTLQSTGEGYFRLDMLSDYRDFLQCLLYGNGNLKSDWLTLASEAGLEEMEATNWYERFNEDGILQEDSYYINDLLAKDLDGNGQVDLMLITKYNTKKLSNVDYSYFSHAYIYMNQDAVYELSITSELAFDWNQSVSADFDQDGYVEIGYSIFTGGVGASGSFEKGLLKYKNHTLEQMKLPNDLQDEDKDTGIEITVLAEEEKNQYVADCPYLNQKISFQRETDLGIDEIQLREGEEVGGNVRGYYEMEVTDENGVKVLTLLEYLCGENGTNDKIADAVFTVRFDEKDEAYISDLSIDPY